MAAILNIGWAVNYSDSLRETSGKEVSYVSIYFSIVISCSGELVCEYVIFQSIDHVECKKGFHKWMNKWIHRNLRAFRLLLIDYDCKYNMTSYQCHKIWAKSHKYGHFPQNSRRYGGVRIYTGVFVFIRAGWLHRTKHPTSGQNLWGFFEDKQKSISKLVLTRIV